MKKFIFFEKIASSQKCHFQVVTNCKGKGATWLSYDFLKPSDVDLHKQLRKLCATTAQAKYHCSKPQKIICRIIFQAK